jgi:hypothetical protein
MGKAVVGVYHLCGGGIGHCIADKFFLTIKI